MLTNPRVHRPAKPGVDLLIGRALALGVHPVIAWRTRPRSRIPMAIGYFAVSYLVVLALLFL